VVAKVLSERQHNCSRCGFTAPRDVNAALNILSRGRGRTGPPRKGFLTPARAGVAGCPPL
jgi:transposase